MHNRIDGSYTIFHGGAFRLSQFPARESPHILESDEEFVPAVRQPRKQRISSQYCAESAQTPAVTPRVDKALKRLKQFRVVFHRRISLMRAGH